MASGSVTKALRVRFYGDSASAVTSFNRLGKSAQRTGKHVGGLRGHLRNFMRSAAGTALATVGLTGGLYGLYRVAKYVIQAGSDQVETFNKVGVVMGKGAAQMIKWSEDAATKLGMSQQEALDSASTFAIFGRQAGLTGNDLAAFCEQLVQMGTDLGSLYNVDPIQVMDDIKSGLAGQVRPMRKYGIMLDEASKRNEAFRMGLIKTKDQALTPYQKVLATRSLIMKRAKIAEGDFARTSGQTANQQRILKAQMKDLASEIGMKLLPVITGLMRWLTGTGIPRLSEFTLGLMGSKKATGDFAQAGKLLRGAIERVVGILTTLIGFFKEHTTTARTLAAVLGTIWTVEKINNLVTFATHLRVVVGLQKAFAAASMLSKLATAGGAKALLIYITQTRVYQAVVKTAIVLTKLFHLVMMAGPWGWIALAIVAVVAAFVLLWTKCAWFRDFWIMVWEQIKHAVAVVIAWLTGPFVTYMIGVWNAIKAAAMAVANWFAGPFVGFFIRVWNVLKGAFNAVKNALIQGWNAVWAAFASVVGWFTGPFANGMIAAWNVIKRAALAVASWFMEWVYPTLRAVFVGLMWVAWALWQGIKAAWNGIKSITLWLWHNVFYPAFSAIKAIVLAVANWFMTWVVGSFLRGCRAVWAAMSWLWKNVFVPYWNAIKHAVLVVVNWFMTWVVGTFLKGCRDVWAAMVWLWKNVFIPIWNGIKVAVAAVVNWFRTWVIGSFKWVGDKIAAGATWLWKRGIQPAWQGIKDFVAGIVNWFKGTVVGGIKTAMDKVQYWVWWALDKVKKFFDTCKKGVGTVWDGLKKVVKAPVKFIVEKVYGKGIRGFWNLVAKVLPLAKLDPPPPTNWRTGGVVGRGRGHRDDQPALLQRGEGVLNNWEMQKIGGPKGFMSLREHIARFAKGGVVPGSDGVARFGLGGWLSKAWKFGGGAVPNWLASVAGKGKDLVVGTVLKAVRPAINQIHHWVDDKIPNVGIGKMLRAGVDKIIDSAVGMIQANDVAYFGAGGASIQATQKWLKSIAGKVPYVWGGVGPGGYDCSGLVGDVWAMLTGNPRHRRYFTTSNEGAFAVQHGFAKGGDNKGFTIGWNGVHTTGSVGGLNFEAPHAGAMVRVGSGASSPLRFPHIMHLMTQAGPAQLSTWIAQAIGLTGVQPFAKWAAGLRTLIMRESNGNPNAINLWDTNAKAGHPSQGLMQLIPSTFASFRLANLPNSIKHPIANIAAGIRYILARYGDISRVQQANPAMAARGYAGGVRSALPGMAWVGENGPELLNFRGGESVTPVTAGGLTVVFHKGSIVVQGPVLGEKDFIERSIPAIVKGINEKTRAKGKSVLA